MNSLSISLSHIYLIHTIMSDRALVLLVMHCEQYRRGAGDLRRAHVLSY